ncbi:MAG: hypothetical protein WCQ21_06795 [Verrucomicrobiota bacterium]
MLADILIQRLCRIDLCPDIRPRVLTHLSRENAASTPPEILRCTQKLLSRVLF